METDPRKMEFWTTRKAAHPAMVEPWTPPQVEIRHGWIILSTEEWINLERMEARERFPVGYHGIYATIEREDGHYYRWRVGDDLLQGFAR